MAEWNEADDGDEADEGDEPDDESAGGDSVDTLACPYCGKAVYEGAEVCPHCRSYISEEDQPARRRPWWILAAVGLTLAAIVLHWVFGR